jgi:hypothetical protein
MMQGNPKQAILQQPKSAARENGRTELVARSKSKSNHPDQPNKASHCLTRISSSTSHARHKSHQLKVEIAGTGRVGDQGKNYHGIEATNPKINQQK